MIERLKQWNQERKLSAHERFVLKAGRRIVENRKREQAGLPPKGWVVPSAEPVRAYCPAPRQVSEIEGAPSSEARVWAESFRRVESPEGTSCFEQVDSSGKVLGRVWVPTTTEVEFIKE